MTLSRDINTGDPTHAAKPNIDPRGCPVLEVITAVIIIMITLMIIMENPLSCFSKSTSCVHGDRTNLYKTVLARSWWHCGEWIDHTLISELKSPLFQLSIVYDLIISE